MYKKLCTNCHQPSFSSCESGVWICPVCHEDLTGVQAQAAESQVVKPMFQQIEERLKYRLESKSDEKSTFNRYI